MACKFEDLCEHRGTSYCEDCTHDPEYVRECQFDWNGEDEEPTQEELADETYS